MRGAMALALAVAKGFAHGRTVKRPSAPPPGGDPLGGDRLTRNVGGNCIKSTDPIFNIDNGRFRYLKPQKSAVWEI